MADITPLPSPLVQGESPGPWKQLATEIDSGKAVEIAKPEPTPERRDGGLLITNQIPSKRKPYHGLTPVTSEARQANISSHNRNRSISEYVAEVIHVPRPRLPTISGPGAQADSVPLSGSLIKREDCLAERRGLVGHDAGLPKPPHSTQSGDSNGIDASAGLSDDTIDDGRESPADEYFCATRLKDNTRWMWRAVRLLGEGAFSKVFLAASMDAGDWCSAAEYSQSKRTLQFVHDGRFEFKNLVAVKVVEHRPAGGTSAERVESSLKRELEIMKSVRHPSLVHLIAFGIEPTRALLVMSYCPGGDLFDVASKKHDSLTPALIGRIFAELVAATRYLHAQFIVHRDIKLESMSAILHTSLL